MEFSGLFKPGLVGGHCIGVDPYYLTHKSIQLGYTPEIVLAGRKINDRMSVWFANLLIKGMTQKNIPIGNSHVLIMGYTFKEDCIDTRNTQVEKIIHHLKEFNINVDIYDPYINVKNFTERKENFISEIVKGSYYDGIIICVAHKEFKNKKKSEWLNLCKEKSIIIDVKSILPKDIEAIRI